MQRSIVHSDHQRPIKSLPFLITSEIRLFILCTNVIGKSGTKDAHSRYQKLTICQIVFS